MWLIGFLGLASLQYCLNYPVASKSTQTLTIFATVVLGLGVGLWSSGPGVKFRRSVPGFLICLLLVASLWSMESFQIFEYRGRVRMAGPWDNPNLFGLLMGVGTVLGFGFLVLSLRTRKWLKVACAFLCLLAVVFMGRGLFQSYSRGAWLATMFGTAYLVYQVLRVGNSTPHPVPLLGRGGEGETLLRPPWAWWFRRNFVALLVVAVSVVVVFFWQYRQTEWHPARRAMSVANVNDFSWRNRIAAWEGTLQIMAEHPWFGSGWNEPEPLYGNYYLPVRLTESAAIQMNDYLLLGATLGIPALFCLGMYFWLSFSGTKGISPLRRRDTEKKIDIETDPNSASPRLRASAVNSEWVQTICRAGAIVLLVGFWFDGGMFKLATASTFWILLELGKCVDSRPRRGDAEERRKDERETREPHGEG